MEYKNGAFSKRLSIAMPKIEFENYLFLLGLRVWMDHNGNAIYAWVLNVVVFDARMLRLVTAF
jgi:hypothetical protein